MSDGGEDQGAEEALWGNRESFSSVLEAVSRVSGSPISAWEPPGTHLARAEELVARHGVVLVPHLNHQLLDGGGVHTELEHLVPRGVEVVVDGLGLLEVGGQLALSHPDKPISQGPRENEGDRD